MVVHRPIFEDAFRTSSSSNILYGSNRPAALLFAMLACGAQSLRSNILGDADKLRVCRAYCARSRDLLLSGLSGGGQGIADVELAQSVVLLFEVLSPSGKAPQALGLLARGVDAVRRLCLDPGGPQALTASTPPDDHLSWLRNDIALRCWINIAALDIEGAFYSERQPMLDYFSETLMALPCHELYFNFRSSEAAFRLLFQPGMPANPVTVDLSAFSQDLSIVHGQNLVRHFVEPVFKCRTSYLALVHLNNYLRVICQQLRTFAIDNDIVPLQTVAKPIEHYSDKEALFMDRAVLLESMVQSVYDTLPHGIGEALAVGDAELFFNRAEETFADLSHAHMFFTLLVCMRTYTVQQLFPDEIAGPSDVDFFNSCSFLSILKNGVVFARMVEGQLRVDPELTFGHYYSLVPALRIAALNIAAIQLLAPIAKASGDEHLSETLNGFAHDVLAIDRYITVTASHYGPVATRVTANFRRTIIDVGIHAVLPKLEELHENPPNELGRIRVDRLDVSEPGKALAELVLGNERMLKAWLS